MIEFNLNFVGYIDRKPYSFTYSLTFDALLHPLQEGSTFLLVGADKNDDVSPGGYRHGPEATRRNTDISSVEWDFDGNLGHGRVGESGVDIWG